MRVFGEYDIHKQEIIGGQLLQIVPFTEKRDLQMLLKKLGRLSSVEVKYLDGLYNKHRSRIRR